MSGNPSYSTPLERSRSGELNGIKFGSRNPSYCISFETSQLGESNGTKFRSKNRFWTELWPFKVSDFAHSGSARGNRVPEIFSPKFLQHLVPRTFLHKKNCWPNFQFQFFIPEKIYYCNIDASSRRALQLAANFDLCVQLKIRFWRPIILELSVF